MYVQCEVCNSWVFRAVLCILDTSIWQFPVHGEIAYCEFQIAIVMWVTECEIRTVGRAVHNLAALKP
jgi:hypothetical protein